MVELEDPFGPVLAAAAGKSTSTLERGLGRAAAAVQRNATLGIRRQLFRGEWPGLTPAYATRKAMKGHGTAILIAEGDLSGSIEMSRKSTLLFAVGTNIVYSRAQELGYAPRNLPARPFMAPALRESESEIKASIMEAVSSIL
ncbi:MAG: phage morphogenesis protein [Spirochaetales bacterium]|nr:phage morphogenesis protein [Spirochaetales bacterium]